MRTGSCALQQGLTQEAAGIVKQALTLAKRRGHAQVTPLHVASTMLSITNGLLRNACLQSHSHPLQCKALELCFNVALNRLPASTSSPMLGPHHHHSNQSPSISNALVAAFKRAQAHQRRGSIESHQQPSQLLVVKIELEQLIISILDDPSVSRVMREAGFSSLQVKSNVEQAVSLEICSKSKNNSTSNNNNSPNSSLSGKKSKDHNNNYNNKKTLVLDPIIRDEDVSCVVENLVSDLKRKSIVIVGECVSTLEDVVKGVMEKVEKGDEICGEVLSGVKFVHISLSSFVNLSRVEVEQKVQDLIIRRNHCSKGCVLYLGDLKWVFDYRASNYSSRQQGRVCYCPVDHMIMEIAKMVSCFGDKININNNVDDDGRFWIMGIATFQAYMKCKNGEPSLEALWGLHPITIPSGSLSLSLITHSGQQNQTTKPKSDDDGDRTSRLLLEGVGKSDNNNNNHHHPSSMVVTQVRSLQSMISTCNSESSSSSLPAWLQQYKNENRGVTISNDQDCVPMGELCKKWNSSMCHSMQKQQPYPSEKTLTLLSSPSSSNSGFSYEHQNPITINKTHPFWISSSNPNSNPNSTSSSDDIIMEMEYTSKFKELNSENLKTLCNALEKKVPWQKEIIPEIVSTILQCRSGMLRRKWKNNNNKNNKNYDNNNYVKKEETWFFFQGVDVEGSKEKIARELARVVFGSSKNNFVSISLSSFASSSITREDSNEEDNYYYCRNNSNKRSREEQSYIERFVEAVSCNPHRVFFIEDIEQADYCSQLGFKRAIERGKVEDSKNGEEFGLCDAIIILSCESFSSRSRVCSPKNYLTKQNSLCEGSREEKNNKDDGDVGATLEETRNPNCVSLDLNISIDDDGESDEDRSMDEIGLVESVDKKVIFKIQEL